MAEPKLIRVNYEGDDDRVVLEGLQKRTLVPDSWEIAIRDKAHQGKDGLITDLTPFIRPIGGVGGSAIALIDLDDLTIEQLNEWFQRQLQRIATTTHPTMTCQSTQSPSGRISLSTLFAGELSGRVVLIAVGIPDDATLRGEFGIERFAVDDYVLRLVLNERVFAAVSEFKEVAHTVAMKKMREVAALLRENGLPVSHAKRYLQILRAIAAFRPSSAVLIDRMMTKAGETISPDEIRAAFHPLVDDLAEAAKMLSG